MQNHPEAYGVPKKEFGKQSQIIFYATSPTNISTPQSIRFGSAPNSITGDAFYYQSDSTVGTRIYARYRGIYSFTASGTDGATTFLWFISKNQTAYNSPGDVSVPQIGYASGPNASDYINISGVVPMNPGDFVTVFYTASTTPANGTFYGTLIAAF